MTKKQNASAIRTEFDRVTADDNAWAIFKGSEPVAKVFIRYGGRSSPNGLTVRAFVHVLGLPMVRGISRGGGYDMKSAAVISACEHLPDSKPSHIPGIGDVLLCGNEAQAVTSLQAIKDAGHTWDQQLTAMGFTVFQVV